MSTPPRVFSIVKELAYRLHVNAGFFLPYRYMFSPSQLAYLSSCISEVDGVDGAIVEVGGAYGDTTVYLHEHMRTTGIRRAYVCVDTFSGFTQRDLDDEVTNRGRPPPAEMFRHNKRKWVQRTLDVNHADGVTLYQADAATFDFSQLGPIAFCLVDVDLYFPVKRVLERVFDLVPSGGRIVVDDCGQKERVARVLARAAPGPWEGAYEAYTEFVAERGLPQRILLDKLGVIEK